MLFRLYLYLFFQSTITLSCVKQHKRYLRLCNAVFFVFFLHVCCPSLNHVSFRATLPVPRYGNRFVRSLDGTFVEAATRCGVNIVSGNYWQSDMMEPFVWSFARGEDLNATGCVSLLSHGRWTIRVRFCLQDERRFCFLVYFYLAFPFPLFQSRSNERRWDSKDNVVWKPRSDHLNKHLPADTIVYINE